MAFSEEIACKVRSYLHDITNINVEEKKMFRGLTFMVNGKMCVSVSGDNLMCRYDPSQQEVVSKMIGFQIMIMKGREYKGYCYVNQEGIKSEEDFKYWLNLCLAFNHKAKSSKKK